MHEELIDKQKGKYAQKDVQVLEEIDQLLTFSSFSSLDAFQLGKTIIECSPKYKEGVAFNIQRCSDEAIIFQYMDDNKAQRNLNFAELKRNTVLVTKHNSLWALVKSCVDEKVEEAFQESNPCLPVGGAFPVIVNGEMVATVALSGLHNGNDFRLLLEAISKYLKVEVPSFEAEIL